MRASRRCRTNPTVVVSPPAPDAIENLQFIRRTLEVSGSFTAVPGWGLVTVGVTAIGAAIMARQQPTTQKWVAVWLGEAIIGMVIVVWAMYAKAQRTGVSLLAAPGRRFALGLAPPLIAGAVLTPILYYHRALPDIPGTWLLMYGTAVVTGGTYSIRIVPVMGACFMAIGLISLFTPATWVMFWMITGFAGLHIVFGYLIARNYGG
ncbi:MAG: hypothetical protein ACXVZV_00845 [Terriglobales bacterium]